MAKERYYVMNRDVPILWVEYDRERKAFAKIIDVSQLELCPQAYINAVHDKTKNNRKELTKWFQARSIPSNRKSYSRLMERLGVKSSKDLIDRYFGLSLSDQYWIKPQDSEIAWQDINCFDHEFPDGDFLEAALMDRCEKKTIDLHTPNGTCIGKMDKAWINEAGKRILVKGTYEANGQEPINEWLASEIGKRLGFDVCSYDIAVVEGQLVSKCACFISSEEEIITAKTILSSKKKGKETSDFQHYLSILAQHGIQDGAKKVSEMLIIDYLMMDEDRHLENFGVIRSAVSGEWLRCTPIYDTGQALNSCHDDDTLHFEDGKGIFFTEQKAFSTYPAYMSSLKDVDLTKLDDLDLLFNHVLKLYQPYTMMNDERIEKLTSGLSMRIEALKQAQT